MSALIGYALAETKALATLGVTTYVLGSAEATLPASLWMGRVGRRGFMAGAAINIAGCALASVALWAGNFALFCIAAATIGVYNAIGLQYWFAAAEVAAPGFRATAISLVSAGGIVGGFLGPAEKVKTQGGNDFIVFATMGISSISSGALVSLAGWERMNAVAIPVFAVVAAAVGSLAWLRARDRYARNFQ